MKEERDRNKKAVATAQLKSIERDLQRQMEALVRTEELPEWLVEGINTFIDTFMPRRINFRVYPFESVPSFQIRSNLKRDCFVEEDLDNILLAYGTRPNVKLTLLGLITSIPDKAGHPFDPTREFEEISETETSEAQKFEHEFRKLSH